MDKIIDRDDFIKNHAHESLFIEAGAGAGKSTTMVSKIVQNILSGVLPEKIVAITFTNKSAEDLLIRVTKEVDKARKNTANPEQKAKLDNAFYSLYKMKISTIHSFCYKILSEYSFAAKIPFGVKLIVEDDVKKLTDNSYNEWRRSLPSNDFVNIENLSLALGKNAENAIKQTYDTLCEKMLPDIEIVDVEHFDIAPYYDYLKSIFDFLKKGMIDGYHPNDRTQTYITNILENFFITYDHPLESSEEGFIDYYVGLKEAYDKRIKSKPFSTAKKYNNAEEANITNEQYDELIKDASDKLEDLNTYFWKDINSYALKAYEYYLNHKRHDVITNNELIYQTYLLVKNNLEARKQIANQYDVIYVDEFQDTDRYQIELISTLTSEIDKRKSNKDIGSLVVVGDPKQSIYRFRGADFASYMGFKDIFTSLGKNEKEYRVVCLPDNFRSSSIILDWVNDTYSRMNFYDGYVYEPMLYPDNHKLIDYSNHPKALAGIYLKKLQDTKDYSLTAELVDCLVKNHYEIMETSDFINKKSPYIWREIKYSDFMIIFNSKTNLNACAKAFAKRGIPYDITGKLEVSRLLGIRQLVRIVNYLLIPDEDNKKTALEILSHHFDNPSLKLDELFNETKLLSNYGKLYYVFNHYDDFVDNLNSIDTQAIQSAIYQILENILRKDNMSAVEMMDAIFDTVTTYQDTALSVTRENNAVRIMNAHQTKGLEANIIIFVTAGEKNAADNIELLDGKIYLNSLNQHKDIKELCSSQIIEECLRKEYVVSTRARQVMIFDEDLLSAKNQRLYNFTDYPYDWSILDQYQINELPLDVSTPISDDNKAFVKNKLDKIEASYSPLFNETTPSQLEKRKTPLDEEKEKIDNGVHRPKDNVFGTMLHRCNELFAINPNRDFKDIVNTAMKENDKVDGYYAKYLLKCLYATKELFIKNNYLENTLKPEFKFYYFINQENTPILMNGSIDLLMINDKEINIIDYKSDSADYINKEQFEEILKDNYLPQLEAYKQFCQTIYPDYKINIKIIWYEEINDMTTAHLLNLN